MRHHFPKLHPRLATITLLAALLGAQVFAGTPADTSSVKKMDHGSKLAKGWQNGAFMEIFVRAWRDSDGDGIGDLRGLTQSLDYLKELGIKGIWLMPITGNDDGDHGYATTDFRGIAPEYGTLADFDEMIREAHKRGIGVIMDYVINHSAATHPLFLASKDPASPYRDWYIWRDPPPADRDQWDIWGKNPWYATPNGTLFATFGPHMPDFNFRNPAVRKFHEDSLRFWLNRGLDGYRLDAVPHLVENNAKDWNDQPESRQITRDLRKLITSYAKRYVVCEATAKPVDYAARDLCGGAFAFGHQENIVKAAKGDATAVKAVADYFTTAPATMATMVSNHDIFAGRRLWDQVEGNVAQYKLAAATYLLQPGTPFIYYGEEIGMAGVPGLEGDLPLRAPMSWTDEPGKAGFTTGTPFRPIAPNAASQNAAAERAKPDSIFAFYKTMLTLRNSYASLANGSYKHPWANDTAMGFQRISRKETSVVAINYGIVPIDVTVTALPERATLRAAYPKGAGDFAVSVSGNVMLSLPPQSVRVFVVKR
ncbi:MAG: alpha-amylase [Rhodoferax sp.]|nr:alpha-amylase [Rhodoferax sp.]